MKKKFMSGLVAVLLSVLVFMSGCSNFNVGINGTNNTPNESLNSSENDSRVSKKEVKRYLVEKYKPGTCFGMPKAVSESEVNQTLKDNSQLVRFIKSNFNVSDARDVYNKVEQFSNINVSEYKSGFKFILRDGDCCNVTTYMGFVHLRGGIEINVRDKKSQNVSC